MPPELEPESPAQPHPRDPRGPVGPLAVTAQLFCATPQASEPRLDLFQRVLYFIQAKFKVSAKRPQEIRHLFLSARMLF